MVYATYSTGFRPGGVNRVYDAAIKAIFPPYQADYLKNYELGWKTQWLNHHLRWNGALFVEDWHNFQLAYLGPNSVTVVQNAASARIKGVETNLEWAAGGGLAAERERHLSGREADVELLRNVPSGHDDAAHELPEPDHWRPQQPIAFPIRGWDSHDRPARPFRRAAAGRAGVQGKRSRPVQLCGRGLAGEPPGRVGIPDIVPTQPRTISIQFGQKF